MFIVIDIQLDLFIMTYINNTYTNYIYIYIPEVFI